MPPYLLAAGLRLMLAVQRVPEPWRTRLRQAVTLHLEDVEAATIPSLLKMREVLKHDPRLLTVQDHGAGTRRHALQDDAAGVRQDQRVVADVYGTAASPHPWALFLFKLVRELRPRYVLELGTNLGVSACYLNTALALNGQGRLTTVEGDASFAEIARHHLARTTRHPVDVVVGRFQDVLPELLPRIAPLDLVFLDGHHEEEATLRYFEQIAPYLSPRACVVFDDVEPWRGVYQAYRRLHRARPDLFAVHLGKIALLLGDGKEAAWLAR